MIVMMYMFHYFLSSMYSSNFRGDSIFLYFQIYSFFFFLF